MMQPIRVSTTKMMKAGCVRGAATDVVAVEIFCIIAVCAPFLKHADRLGPTSHYSRYYRLPRLNFDEARRVWVAHIRQIPRLPVLLQAMTSGLLRMLL